MKTYSAKPSDVSRKWYVFDASELPMGRLASEVAKVLLGKNKPQFTKHIDVGDFAVVINTEKLIASGNKAKDKIYYRHSGYPGGLKSRTLEEQMTRDPNKIIYNAVRGMLPVNKLRPDRLKRLKLYSGEEHSHSAQKPEKISLKGTK